MSELPTVSIVVPVYGVEKYIGRCFDSVAAQTYPKLECIFVDDCGNDASMDIVRSRIAAYRGDIAFRIVRHEHNRGLSAARNTGTDAAEGGYVYFLDSDDLIVPDCIALLAEPLRERRVDFVLGNYVSGGDRVCYIPVKVSDGFISGNAEIRARYLRGEWFMMAWGRLVNRAFLLREKLRFVEGLLHEDNLWSFQLACLAESMCIVRAPTYIYVIRGDSITTAKSRKNLDSLVRIADEMDAFVRERALEADAGTAGFVAAWREALVIKACPYGAAWSTYRSAVRPRGFSWRVFRALGAAWKLRYLHHLLPAPIGFVCVLAAGKVVSIVMFLKRRLKKTDN